MEVQRVWYFLCDFMWINREVRLALSCTIYHRKHPETYYNPPLRGDTHLIFENCSGFVKTISKK